MKYILIFFIITHPLFLSAMNDDQKEKRKSYSPGRIASVVSNQHSRHNSLTDKVLITLHLKTDEIRSCTNTVEALVTDRSSSEAHAHAQEKDSLKKSKGI